MNNQYEITYFKRTAIVNYLLLSLYLTISVTCHAIANRLILIEGQPIISAGLIYMAVFIITDIMASYNPRKIVILMIFMEVLVNLFFVLYTNIIANMPFPDFFLDEKIYRNVFSPIIPLYIANLGGTFCSAIIDLFFFYFLYKNKKWPFFLASFSSSIITISCYTYITDYFGFRNAYPHHVFQLTFINLLTNFITLFLYSVIGQGIVKIIHKYLNKQSC